jgi:hypothetical protein
MRDSLLDFTEKQNTLDDLNSILTTMYQDDEEFNTEESIRSLTDRTYVVMEYIANVQDKLIEDPSVLKTSETFDIPIEQVAKDVSEVMLMSTVASQAMAIEKLILGG